MAELWYKPWGESRGTPFGTTPTPRRFTGQVLDSVAGGLYFYNARYYDPVLGRFAQADTIVPEPVDPQALNRYSYVGNNPLRFIDDSGERAIDIVGGAGGGGGAGMAVVMLANGLAQTVGQQVSALTVRMAPAANATVQTWSLAGNQVIAAADQLSQAAQNAGQAGNTADPGGLDPNDPLFRRLIQQTGETDPIKAIARASVEGPAREGARNGVTVLGRYPAYVNTANDLRANYLNFAEGTWDKLTDAQRWIVNKQFLDDAIARGDKFKLASLVDEAKPGTYFRKELEYLISLGYEVAGDLLVKVK
jgi:RHS repeat-associated protein